VRTEAAVAVVDTVVVAVAVAAVVAAVAAIAGDFPSPVGATDSGVTS